MKHMALQIHACIGMLQLHSGHQGGHGRDVMIGPCALYKVFQCITMQQLYKSPQSKLVLRPFN